MKKFLRDLWAKYAHVRFLLLVLSQVQAALLSFHPQTPQGVRAVSLAGAIIGGVIWFLKGTHTDVMPSAPGTIPNGVNPEQVLQDVPEA